MTYINSTQQNQTNRLAELAQKPSPLKLGKNLIDDIAQAKAHIQQVFAEIQKLNLPPNVNALSINPDINHSIYEANVFVKQILRKYDKTAKPEQKVALQDLRHMITSAKLGGQITPEMLANHPQFERFMKKSNWSNAAVAYNQVLPVVNGEPGVLFDGEAVAFSKLQDKKNPKDGAPPITNSGDFWGSTIIESGLTFHWPYHFDNIIPKGKGNPADWGNQYVIEIVTSLKDPTESTPVFSGDHTMLRMKTQNGDIYSFGVYGPMSAPLEYAKRRLNVTLDGCFDCPDRYETIDRNENFFHETAVSITEAQFNSLKNQILELGKKTATNNERNVPFGFLKTNCTGIIKEILKDVGIKIKAHMTVTEFIGRKLFSRNVRQFFSKNTPAFIRKILSIISRPFTALALILGGALTCSKEIKANYGDKFKAEIPRFRDLFKPAKMNHPLALRKWQHKVDNWRTAQKQMLTKKQQELEEQLKNAPTKSKITAQIASIQKEIQAIPFTLPT